MCVMLPPVVKKLCGRIFICVKNCKHFKINVSVQNCFDETTSSLTFCKDICLRKFSLTEKKFRQINFLVISLIKPLLSRNFWEKSVRENLWNFHFDFSFFYTSHCGNFTATILSQKFRQSTFTLFSKLIWRKNFRGSEFFVFPQCAFWDHGVEISEFILAFRFYVKSIFVILKT